MAVINHTQKWIYLMEPHTGSRVVADYLVKNLGGSQIGHHHIALSELTNRNRQHVSAKQVQDYKVIATVRNPFDMLVTKWKYSGHGGLNRKRAETIARHTGTPVEVVLENRRTIPWRTFNLPA